MPVQSAIATMHGECNQLNCMEVSVLNINVIMQLHALPSGKPATQVYSCQCGKTYHNRSGLHKHIKNYPSHKSDTGKRQESAKINCGDASCTFSCRYLNQLRKHLTESHGIVLNQEQKKFSSEDSKYFTEPGPCKC